MRLTARHLVVSAIVASPLILAGCGKGGDEQVAKGPVHKGIYTSAADCEGSGKITLEMCAKAMELAVAEHEKTAPQYGSIENCEAKEGKNRCERTESKYRPMLQAFLITTSEPPQALPLYSPLTNVQGFRGPDKKNYLTSDETIGFSEHAFGIAEVNKASKLK